MPRHPAALADAVADEGVPDRYTERPPVARSGLERALLDAIDRQPCFGSVLHFMAAFGKTAGFSHSTGIIPYGD